MWFRLSASEKGNSLSPRPIPTNKSHTHVLCALCRSPARQQRYDALCRMRIVVVARSTTCESTALCAHIVFLLELNKHFQWMKFILKWILLSSCLITLLNLNNKYRAFTEQRTACSRGVYALRYGNVCIRNQWWWRGTEMCVICIFSYSPVIYCSIWIRDGCLEMGI